MLALDGASDLKSSRFHQDALSAWATEPVFQGNLFSFADAKIGLYFILGKSFWKKAGNSSNYHFLDETWSKRPGSVKKSIFEIWKKMKMFLLLLETDYIWPEAK